MKVLVSFQPKNPEHDHFEGARLRMSIKGALESVGVSYTTEVVDNYDVAHFISPEDEVKVNTAIDKGVPIVVSCMYSEGDPLTAYIDVKHKNGVNVYSLKPKALKFLQKADVITVPSEYCKNLLIENGIQAPIYVVPVGVNISRFDFSRDDEKEIFYRYFREDKNKRLVISLGEYNHTMSGITAFINAAKKNPNTNFYYFGKLTGKTPRKIKKYLKEAPKNIKFNSLVPDDVYRSALLNASLFMIPGYNYLGSINIIEAMAARCQIITRAQNANIFHLLKNEETAYIGEFSETLTALTTDFLEGKIKPTIENAYHVVSQHNYKSFGHELVSIYQNAINNKK